MQLEKIEEKEETLTRQESDNLFRSIVMGQDVTEVIKTKKGDFKVKFPRIRDTEKIGKLVAARLNGIPLQSFDRGVYEVMYQVATLDVIVISGPAWYELAKKENLSFSWRDIPSLSLIEEVYAKAYNFRQKVQKQLESNSETRDNTMGELSIDNNSREPELFEGMEN